MKFTIPILSLILTSWPATLPAEPAVYEGFAYSIPTSPILMGGGQGFDGSWDSAGAVIPAASGTVPQGGMQVLPESLSYTDGVRTLVTTGGSLEVTGESGNAAMGRALDLDQLPHPGNDPKVGRTTYISFLAQRAGEAADPNDPVYEGNYPYGENLYPRSAGIGFHSWNGGEVLELKFGNLSNQDTDVWRFTGEDLYGDERRDARSSVPFGEGNQTRLVVIRIDHGGGGWQGDRLSVWIDPVLAAEAANGYPVTFDWTTRDDPLYVQPAYISVAANNANALRPFSVLLFDEFRVGDSWESVTPHAGGQTWGGRAVVDGNSVATGDRFLGWLEVGPEGWSFSSGLNSWAYIPESMVEPLGAWMYLMPTGRSTPAMTEILPRTLAYEGFDYTTSNENPLHLVNDAPDGGMGWGEPWNSNSQGSAFSDAYVLEGSMAYQDLGGYQLETSGGHAWIAGVPSGEFTSGINTRLQRALAEPPQPLPGQPVYISFLGQRVGTAVNLEDPLWSDTEIYPNGYPWGANLFPRGAGLSLLESAGNTDNSAHAGNFSNESVNAWTFSAESTDIRTDLPFTDPALMVVRLDYFPGQASNLHGEVYSWTGTRATIWMNPVDLLQESGNSLFREVIYRDLVDPFAVLVGGVALHAGDDSFNRPHAELLVDEIRVGNTWDTVTPVVGGRPQLPPAEALTWGGQPLYAENHVWGGHELGWLWTANAPWLFAHKLKTWLYHPEMWMEQGQNWFFVLDNSR